MALQSGSAKTIGLPRLLMNSSEGQPWGELPGELRTRLVQDLRTRYGADYAEVIQRYFERLSDIPLPKTKLAP
jgi:hypothetical protein